MRPPAIHTIRYGTIFLTFGNIRVLSVVRMDETIKKKKNENSSPEICIEDKCDRGNRVTFGNLLILHADPCMEMTVFQVTDRPEMESASDDIAPPNCIASMMLQFIILLSSQCMCTVCSSCVSTCVVCQPWQYISCKMIILFIILIPMRTTNLFVTRNLCTQNIHEMFAGKMDRLYIKRFDVEVVVQQQQQQQPPLIYR